MGEYWYLIVYVYVIIRPYPQLDIVYWSKSAKFIRLTHWGRVTHICVIEVITIGSDNGLSPGRRQAIIWTNAGILLTGPLGTNFSEILIGIKIFSSKRMLLKMSSAKWRPFCLGLIVLTHILAVHRQHVFHAAIMTWKNFPNKITVPLRGELRPLLTDGYPTRGQ